MALRPSGSGSLYNRTVSLYGDTAPTPGLTPNPSGIGVTGNTSAGPSPGSFGGDAASFLSALYGARPKFIAQQGQLLSTLGPSLRQAVFSASPELQQASDYLTKTFNDPYGGSRETFEDALRGAQAARGFTGGGTGVVGEEARYLTNYAERRRQELLPQLQGFGNNILQLSGLNGVPDLSLSAIGALALQNRTLNETIKAGQQQSAFAQDLFNKYFSGGASGTGAGAGNTLQQLTGRTGSFSFSGQGNAPGAGTPDYFARQSSGDRYEQARILQASGQINTEADLLRYLGQPDLRTQYATPGGGPSAILGGGDTFFTL